MYSGDVLSEEGRKALDACVKVKILGRPETRRYHRDTARKRLLACYAGKFPGRPWPATPPSWLEFYHFILPGDLSTDSDSVDIIDIHDALLSFDERRFVNKYPKEGPGSDKLKGLIDKRRADVERECQQARANPDGRHRYSWLNAQRRVRDCFAGNFAGDVPMLENKSLCSDETYNIVEIHDAFVHYDKLKFVDKHEPREAAINDVKKEYTEALSVDKTGVKCGLREYSIEEALSRVKSCYSFYFPSSVNVIPLKRDESGEPKLNQTYSIFDIHRGICHLDERVLLEKYPEVGPGCDELKRSIDAHRDALEREYQEHKDKAECKYSRSEAERRVKDCFVGPFSENDTDVFPTKEEESGVPKEYQTYDIFDIQKAIEHFDSKRLFDKYPEEEDPKSDEKRKKVDQERASIEEEYKKATASVEIEHGSGFIIQGHFVITNKHVIESVQNDRSKKTQVVICNKAIGEFPCKVAYDDTKKDLALLYCPDLDLHVGRICPLQLSTQSLLPGMQIFSFGYPISHTDETALFVNGYVAGSKRTFSGLTKAVLNCPLNSGNSGSPVLCRVKGELKVVGVATQKHFKEVLSLGERQTIEKIRETLETREIPEVSEFCKEYDSFKWSDSGCRLPDFSGRRGSAQVISDPRLIPMYLLTLKLYDALETHSQFNLSNAVPGEQVTEFIKDSISKYDGEHKDELAEIVKMV